MATRLYGCVEMSEIVKMFKIYRKEFEAKALVTFLKNQINEVF